MKIAFFTDSFLPYISGVSSSINLFSQGLVDCGHEVIIFTPNISSKNRFRPDKRIQIEYVSSIALKKLYPDVHAAKPQIPKTYKKVKRFNPDIIHFHTPFIMGAEAILYGKLLKKPVTGTFHTYFMEPEFLKILRLDNLGKGTSLITRFLWKYSNAFYNQCRLVITPSEYSKKDLKKHGLKRPIKVVCNPFDLNNLKKVKQRDIIRLKKNYWLGKNIVLYVGRLSQEKSLNILILAFKNVLKIIPSAQLVLIGAGPVEKELRELAIGLGIERSIIFTGEISHKNLLDKGYYQLAKLFVTASTSECQPMTFIEAMAFGLPIVAVRARGNIEMVKKNGILCQPQNVNEFTEAIVKCLKDEKLREKLSRQSLIRAQDFSLDKLTSRLEKIYLSI